MVRRQRQSNEKLGAMLAATGLSLGGLALRVNQEGARHGLSLRYQKSGIGNWVSGGCVPRDEVRAIVLGVLSAHAGYAVDGPDVGWPPVCGMFGTSRVPSYPGDLNSVHTVLPALWSGDMFDRRGFTATAVIASAGFGDVLSEYLMSRPDATAARSGAGSRVGMTDVQMVRDITKHIRAMDAAYGSGRFRDDAVMALHRHVAPMLHGSFTDAVGRHLYAAVADLSILAGWLTFDSGNPARAAHYYTTGLRLGRAADNQQLCADALHNMAYLALRADKDGKACVLISRAAVHHDKGLVRPSMALSQARGNAALGNKAEVHRLVNEAFDAWEKSPEGGQLEYHGELTELHAVAASAYADASMPEGLPHAEFAVSHREGTGHVRPLATNYLHRATFMLVSGDEQAAIADADKALAMAPAIASNQLTRRLSGFSRQLARKCDNQAARDFGERVRSALNA